ncbi:MAG: SDR family NAD(P)-dependent oxidoreductase [Bradyrhizobium sp.]|nr:SDR family NAD(P)-dependent oxidoreductase [Bradyrhizobium sp.]
MLALQDRNVVVIGGSRGTGRQVVEMARHAGARVLAVARQEARLRQLEEQVPGTEVLALDASDESSPAKVFGALQPDVLVISGGAMPPAAPLHQQSWQEFSVNWEADVKMAFNFCKAALAAPLRAGSSVVVVSSGAARAGSPISGGYAGSKRTQMFIANYSQKESDRLGLDLSFAALAPLIQPDSEIGRHAVEGYARYLGISEADFVKGMKAPPTSAVVAAGVLEVIAKPEESRGKVFMVAGTGLEAVSL